MSANGESVLTNTTSPADHKPARNDVEYAGGGKLNPAYTAGGHVVDASQPAFPIYHRKLGNPAPLGLLAFGTTTFILSLYNCQTRNITTPNVILGMALGYGGLCQLIAGIEEFVCGNTFGATAFCSYGGFWLSFACLYIPQFGILDAYTVPGELDSALGLYLAAWGIVTFIFLLATFKSSAGLVSVFFFLDLTFWALTGGFLGSSTNAIKAGGGLGIVTAFCAFYVALAGLLTDDTSYFSVPVGSLARNK